METFCQATRVQEHPTVIYCSIAISSGENYNLSPCVRRQQHKLITIQMKKFKGRGKKPNFIAEDTESLESCGSFLTLLFLQYPLPVHQMSLVVHFLNIYILSLSKKYRTKPPIAISYIDKVSTILKQCFHPLLCQTDYG